MAETILRTKLLVPQLRPNLVPRLGLIEQLNEGPYLGHKLTLISAPAGFGKTTLAGAWACDARSRAKDSQSTYDVAWLSLDEDDNDPARFLAYVIAALNQVEDFAAPLGESALGLLRAPQVKPEFVLTSLINDIAAVPNRLLLILDDYHALDSPPIDSALTFLLENLPPQMHIAIVTRADPALPLASLRAGGRLTELRAVDLRFTSAEAAEFLNRVMGLDLSDADVAALESRTEGWIAGLQLAAISMKGYGDSAGFIRSFAGSHHFVLDYLVEDVLEQQPESIQSFLLQTSILSQMTGSLCDVLTGRDDSRATLEMLERTNLFIVRLDEERNWYRYHHLFTDLLRLRLCQTQPDQVLALHRRASSWYERHKFADEAIEHALRGEDFERAASLIEKFFDSAYQGGEHAKLRRWLAALPAELAFSKPELGILRTWNLFSSGQIDAAEQNLQAIERKLDASGSRATAATPDTVGHAPGNGLTGLQGRAEAIRAYLSSYRGDVPGIIQHSNRALNLLPEQDRTWRSAAAIALGDAYGIRGDLSAAYSSRIETLVRSQATGDAYVSMIASLKVAATLRKQGKLQRVAEICRRQWQIAEENSISSATVAGWLLAVWGETLAELDLLDEAVQKAERGAELAGRGRDVAMYGWSHLCQVRVLFTSGDLYRAEEVAQEMQNMAREQDVPPWIKNPVSAWQARIWLAQDRTDLALQWAAERELDVAGGALLLREMEYVVLARILLAQGRLDEADELLLGLLETAVAGQYISREIEIRLLQAQLHQARGHVSRAVSELQHALTIAEPGGFVRIFADEGPAMAHLLYEAVARDIASEYAQRLLAAFPLESAGQAETSDVKRAALTLIEPLSERELEVLELIAQGFTNQEIAARLYLSLNTVKVHTRNIYSKLDTHSRTQAVARARILGVLHST